MAYLPRQKRQLGTTKECYLLFGGSSPLITSYHNRTWNEKGQNHSIYGKNFSGAHWPKTWYRITTFGPFCWIYPTFKQHDLPCFQIGITVGLELDPDLVILTVKNIVHDLGRDPQENPLPVCLLSLQIEDMLDNQLAQILATPNRQRNFELRKEDLGSAGLLHRDISG